MKLNADQLAAVCDLLKQRIEQRGGPAGVRAVELCAQELKGWLSPEELMAAWKAAEAVECKPRRWSAGEHDRMLNYHDPEALEALANAPSLRKGTAVAADGMGDLEMEVISRFLRRLEGGTGLLKHKVRWVKKRRALRPGEKVEQCRGPGDIMCGGLLFEWVEQAVIIHDAHGAVASVFPEARRRGTRKVGWSGKKKPMLEMFVPEMDVSEMEKRRILMTVAVFVRLYRGEGSGFRSAAHIARIVGVERATVSACQIRVAREECAEGAARFKAVRSQKVG